MGGLIQAPGKLWGIYRFDHLEQLGRSSGFVGLQMPDQVEASAREVADFRLLGFELLHVVFPKIQHACCICFANGTRWKNFGHRYQRDGVGIASGPYGGALDTVAHLRQSFANAHTVSLDGCSFPISIVHPRPVGQRDGVVGTLHASSLPLPVNCGLQPVAAEVVVILRFDLCAVDFAERNVGFHVLAGVIEAYGAFGLAVLLGDRKSELAARARRAAPGSDKLTSNRVAGEAAKDQDRQKQRGEGKASHAVQNSSRRPRAQVTIRTVSKTATRRAPGRSAEDLQASVERFLKASRKPVLLEPGEPIIPITGANLLLEVRNSRFTVQAWDDERNVVRRVIAIREETRGRLELVAERFAGKRGALYLIDLARATGADWERRGTRMVFREQFRQFLSREFPAWRIAELSTERDLEHSLSPAYPRALLKRGGAALAAIGSPPDGFSSSGV